MARALQAGSGSRVAITASPTLASPVVATSQYTPST